MDEQGNGDFKHGKIRKLSYLGQIMRHPEKYELPILILQGEIAGKRGVGR